MYIECDMLRFFRAKKERKRQYISSKSCRKIHTAIVFRHHKDANNSLLGCKKAAYTNAAISSSLSPSSISITGISIIV